MYQLTQAKLLEGLNMIINNRLAMLGLLVGLEIFVLSFSICRWVLSQQGKKSEMSEIYSYVLIYPIILIK